MSLLESEILLSNGLVHIWRPLWQLFCSFEYSPASHAF